MNQNDVFVEHIKKHIEQMKKQEKRHGKVMCKICCKTIDEIFKTENPCPWCGQIMLYLPNKRYFRCMNCYTEVAECGTIIGWNDDLRVKTSKQSKK